MKDLVKEPWGKLAYEEENHRLFLTISDPSPNQFSRLLNQTVTAVELKMVDNCLADLSKRKGSTADTLDYSIRSFKIALDHGLRRLAIIQPKEKEEQQAIKKFVSSLGSSNVRAFTKTEEATEWLNSMARQQRAA
jgi:hypothetical protein